MIGTDEFGRWKICSNCQHGTEQWEKPVIVCNDGKKGVNAANIAPVANVGGSDKGKVVCCVDQEGSVLGRACACPSRGQGWHRVWGVRLCPQCQHPTRCGPSTGMGMSMQLGTCSIYSYCILLRAVPWILVLWPCLVLAINHRFQAKWIQIQMDFLSSIGI